MATKKDLVEAYSFSRRRLVTAFVSGAPGGREVEPARPGRMIVGGVALAILLIAGAAVAGALTNRTPVDWDQPGLVTDDTGALYIILEEDQFPGEVQLRPIVNVTSAQLILGVGRDVKRVPNDVLANATKGPQIGILQAPTTVPPTDRLRNSGWVACTADGVGVRTEVASGREVDRASNVGTVVQVPDGKRYLIAEALVPGHPLRAYSYQLPPDNDGLERDLGVSSTDVIEVSQEWLDLFPPGGQLTAAGLGVRGWGAPVDFQGYQPAPRVGDYYERGADTFLVTQRGFVELSPFAAAVLKRSPLPGGVKAARPITATSDAADFEEVPRTYGGSNWPDAVLRDSVPATSQVCGVLQTAPDEEPAVLLATLPSGAAMLDGVDAGRSTAFVRPGFGALVRVGSWTSARAGSAYLVDDTGTSYPVAGGTEVERLGYAKVPKVVVPDSWNKLFSAGPELSYLAALCPPRTMAQDDAGDGAGPKCT